MNAAVKPPHVFAAICGVMEGLAKGISKDRRNQQQGYNFRGIDDVYNASPRSSPSTSWSSRRAVWSAPVSSARRKGAALFYVTSRSIWSLF